MSGLFDSYTLKGVTLRNRIVVSPMCQYMAHDGAVNEWHQTHYCALAKGGAGLVVLEATAVSPEGRITPGDLGIWDDRHLEGLKSLARAIKAAGSVPGIQLAHAGRKAGCTPPWEGGAPVPAGDPQAWQPMGPSAIPYMEGSTHVPREMTLSNIQQVQQDFVEGARRASEAGFKWLELHFAHGFLAQNFLSAHANRRTDAYGGSLDSRARFLVETVAAVRRVWPASLPLTARIGVVDFAVGTEASLADAGQLLQWLKDAGLDFVDAGLSLATAGENVPWGPNLLIPYAERMRRESGLPVGTSWSITTAQVADSFVRDGKVDLVFFGRTLLANPHWPYQAARELGIAAAADVLPTPYAYWLASWAG
ncbi:MAG: NADH:flavin oxidoreductase/NADH oxidase [Comamonadaceae bacterium]|nr:MAG: NADH:flavin oxidoreductase/NADH oxidase [Comamonadaceae bacterium]